MTTKLSEKIVSDALEALDWAALEPHLRVVTLDEESVAKLVALVLRARTMIFRYPGKLKKRNAILSGILALIAERHAASLEGARERFDLLPLIDEAYAGLRALIAAEPLASHSPEYRLAAYLAHIAEQRDAIAAMIEAASMRPRLAGTLILTGQDGSRFSADAATDLLVHMLSMNVMLSGYNGKWFAADDILYLPALPEVTGDDLVAAGAATETALLWRQWQLVEERVRYFGGDLRRKSGTELPEGVPTGGELIEHHARGIEWEVFDAIANERLGDRLGQTFTDMMLGTNLSGRARGIDIGSQLLPVDMVSVQEGHSAVMLSDFLALDSAAHAKEYGGLSLMEWLRGFAVLQQLAQRALAEAGDARSRAFPQFELAELEGILQHNGLLGAKARTFIDHASFARSSRDLYDAPVIRSQDGTLRLAAPALEGALLVRLLLSTFANKEYQVEEKGAAFEVAIEKIFTEQKLEVFKFEATRKGKTYEYDAVVPWGDYLFVFECKNRSLSDSNPIAAFNFLRSVTSHISQVTRLAEALETYPDILTEFVSVDCSDLIIVPVVVSSMPFSYSGDIDGVYFTDASALGRFFAERYTHISRVHRVGPMTLMHRVPTRSQWKGEAPDAEDLLAHLKNPLQLEILQAHFTVEPLGFQIGPARYAWTLRPRRQEMTAESMAAIGGLTAEQVEAEMERFEREVVTELRERMAAKGLMEDETAE